jgi:hypothetical protein
MVIDVSTFILFFFITSCIFLVVIGFNMVIDMAIIGSNVVWIHIDFVNPLI